MPKQCGPNYAPITGECEKLEKSMAELQFSIVDVNIRRLRMKVEDEPSHPAHILTVWGYGYRWEE